MNAEFLVVFLLVIHRCKIGLICLWEQYYVRDVYLKVYICLYNSQYYVVCRVTQFFYL